MSGLPAKHDPHLRLRSKLFVPANRPELFAKALRAGADAVCFDLEDGVPYDQKDHARGTLSAFLQAGSGISAAIILVRVNAQSGSAFAEDIAASVWPGVAAVAMPKVERAEEVRQTATMLAALEQERHISRPIAILPTIESPRGMRNAFAIASADERVMGLQLGFLDLLHPLGIDPQDADAQHSLRFALRLAAGEAELPCYDGAFASVEDLQGLRTDANAARKMGFAGKSCIHPRQIPVVHEVFSPDNAEIERARNILAGSRAAAAAGHGVFVLDGHMVDEPVVRHARQILLAAGIDEE